MNNPVKAFAVVVFLSVFTPTIVGCGGDPAPPPDLSKFVGTWNVQSGTLTVTCSNDLVDTLPVTEPTVFVLGTTSDLMDTGPTCPLPYDVTGHTANVTAGQSCRRPDVISTMHFEVDQFITTDGIVGTHHGSGTLNAFNDISQGNPVRCTWVEDGTYERAASL